jgi:putative SOS response-associated peptidase YedK
MWRDPYRSARCLVPALGWYEWQAREGGKQPYYLFRDAERPIAFAGLMSLWTPPGKEPLLTCAIITGPAAPSAAAIHDRMPLVLPRPAHAAWLDRKLTDAAAVGRILETAAESELRSYPVRALVNSSKLDAAELIEPLS